MRVAASELIVGDHGFYLSVGDEARTVDVGSGNYSIEVWVDPVEPSRARAVALVLPSDSDMIEAALARETGSDKKAVIDMPDAYFFGFRVEVIARGGVDPEDR
jgi:hypothetical protein